MGLNDLGKWLVIGGLAITALGGLIWLLGKLPFLGHLPGDIRIQTGALSCFVPLGTMLLLSLVLTLVLNLVIRLLNK